MRRLLLPAVISAVLATAHQYHFAHLDANWNSRAKTLEVTVRLHADDLEQLLRQRAGRPVELDRDPQAEELAKPAPEVDLVGKWQSVSGTTTIDLEISEESTFKWKAAESGKPAVELSGDFGTNGSAVLMETSDKGSLGGTVKSLSAEEWILNPPGATDDNAGLKFKRVK